MSAFLSGAAVECGPSNVLKNVNGRLERDVSLQQDRLISTPNIAGSSRHGFRQDQRPSSNGQIPRGTNGTSATPFDLSTLQHHLSPSPPPFPHHYQPQSHRPIDQGWAARFGNGHQVQHGNHARASPAPAPAQVTSASAAAVSIRPEGWAAQFDHAVRNGSSSPSRLSEGNAMGMGRQQYESRNAYGQGYNPAWGPAPMQGYRPMRPSMGMPMSTPMSMHMPMQLQQIMPMATIPQAHQSERAREGQLDTRYDPEMAAALEEITRGLAELEEDDRSTQDAQVEQEGPLVDSNGTEWAGHFKDESSNMREDAMNADQAARMEPADIVDDTPADLARVLGIPPPTGRTKTRTFGDQDALLMADGARKSVHFGYDNDAQVGPMGRGVPSSLDQALAHSTAIPGTTGQWEESLDDDHDFDEEAFMAFNGRPRVARDTRIGVGDLEGWGEMQKDWEAFQRGLPEQRENGLKGMGRDDRYLFQSRNPYTSAAEELGVEGREQERVSSRFKGVLELEAAVQADPTNRDAWYTLGLHQQENERESAAILALSKVVQLDPDYRPAYLALGVSYVNEGEMEAANTMFERWVDLAPGGVGTSASTNTGTGTSTSTGWQARQKRLVERLIEIARTQPEEVDADVQVALGVLFNASEEWDKAEDCFMSALGVRPDDWLLYNRLGATLANGGRSTEAVAYYYKALELHPTFVRALFNLGIAYSNTAQYPLAALRLLDALWIQQSDATEGYATGTLGNAAKGVTSETLWNTLRNVCLHMGRSDLVAFASNRDLSGFPPGVLKMVMDGEQVQAQV